MSIKWSTLIADDGGNIDYARLRSFVSVLLAVCGGALMIFAGAMEIVREHDLPTDHVLLAAGALVLPLTGGRIADGVSRRLQKPAPEADHAEGTPNP